MKKSFGKLKKGDVYIRRGSSTAIADANKAHIPVVEAFNQDAGGAPDQGTQAAVTYSFSGAGVYMADDAILRSHCKVSGVTFSVSDEAVAPAQVGGINGEFKKLCPTTCTNKIEDAPVADWSTKLPVLSRSAAAATTP